MSPSTAIRRVAGTPARISSLACTDHVASEGHINTQLTRREYVRAFMPQELCGDQRTAIAWTTAGSVVAIIEMVRDGVLPQQGFLKQEDVPYDDFLSTTTGRLFE